MSAKNVLETIEPIHQYSFLKKTVDRSNALECLTIKSFLGSKLTPLNIQSFQIGTELLAYQPPAWVDSSASSLTSAADGYMVFEGRVRLLCQTEQRQRSYSAMVLNAGDIFGADHLLFSAPLSYTAVAASTCQIVRISASHLAFLREQQPALNDYLSQRMQQRAQLIFFKQFTPLQSLPSEALQRLLLPRITELEIAAGAALNQVIAPQDGYFWLRSGQLCSREFPGRTVAVGSGWSDRDAQMADWVAKTPLRVYQLRLQPWETTELLPILDRLKSSH